MDTQTIQVVILVISIFNFLCLLVAIRALSVGPSSPNIPLEKLIRDLKKIVKDIRKKIV